MKSKFTYKSICFTALIGLLYAYFGYTGGAPVLFCYTWAGVQILASAFAFGTRVNDD